MKSGQTLWAEMIADYDRGIASVAAARRTWAALEPQIDPERFAKIAVFLRLEERDARWWRDASLSYWMSVNGLQLPPGASPPAHDLDWYKAQDFTYAPGHP